MQDISNLIVIVKKNIKAIFNFFTLNFIILSLIFFFLFIKKINEISLEIDLKKFFENLSTSNLIFEIEKENYKSSNNIDVLRYSESEFILFLENSAEIFNNKAQKILNNNQIYNLTNSTSNIINNSSFIRLPKEKKYFIKINGNFDNKIDSESIKLNIQQMVDVTKQEIVKFLIDNYQMQLKFIEKINSRHDVNTIAKIESLEKTLKKYFDVESADENSKKLLTDFLFLQFIEKHAIKFDDKSKFSAIQILEYLKDFIGNQNHNIKFNLSTSFYTYDRSNLIGFFIFLNIANLFIVIFLILFYDGIRKIK